VPNADCCSHSFIARAARADCGAWFLPRGYFRPPARFAILRDDGAAAARGLVQDHDKRGQDRRDDDEAGRDPQEVRAVFGLWMPTLSANVRPTGDR
jgi:hypothetical protein